MWNRAGMMDKGRSLTAEDLYHIRDPGHRHELVSGELRTLPFHGGQNGAISCALASQLNSSVYLRGLGIVIGGGTGYILSRNPDTVRVPFVAFIRNDRIPVGGLPDSFVRIVPNLRPRRG